MWRPVLRGVATKQAGSEGLRSQALAIGMNPYRNVPSKTDGALHGFQGVYWFCIAAFTTAVLTVY